MKKMLFIYNPNAGKGLIKQHLADILDIFVKAGYDVSIYPTQCAQDAYHKILHTEELFDLVVCSGGDGTLDEVVTGMMQRNVRMPIGYIPAGTTNDFASSLNIPKDMLKAAYIAVNGKPFACDIGSFNDDSFVYVAAFGLFTDIPYQTSQSLKKVLGHAAYVLSGAKQLANVPAYSLKITHDGEALEGDFMLGMVTNSKSVGGFKGITGKAVEFNDGEFEVTLFHKPKNLLELQEIIDAFLRGKMNTKHRFTFKAKEVTFESMDEITWTLDGEFGGQHDFVQIRNEMHALQIVIDEKEFEKMKTQKETEN